MIMPIHFDLPIVKQSQNIIKPHHIVEFFYDRFLSYKILQNNFNYQIVSGFNYEILCSFLHHHCNSNL